MKLGEVAELICPEVNSTMTKHCYYSTSHTLRFLLEHREQDSCVRLPIPVEKTNAKLFVFDIEGRILAVTSVLLGLAIGDMTTLGIGNRKLSQILPKDRTTAAGRFLLRHGLNLDGGKVLWIDFDSGLAIHTIPAGNSEASRLKRLQSNNMKDRRATLGCVNVTKEFYRNILSPLFDNANGYIYILPETMQTASFFGISR